MPARSPPLVEQGGGGAQQQHPRQQQPQWRQQQLIQQLESRVLKGKPVIKTYLRNGEIHQARSASAGAEPDKVRGTSVGPEPSKMRSLRPERRSLSPPGSRCTPTPTAPADLSATAGEDKQRHQQPQQSEEGVRSCCRSKEAKAGSVEVPPLPEFVAPGSGEFPPAAPGRAAAGPRVPSIPRILLASRGTEPPPQHPRVTSSRAAAAGHAVQAAAAAATVAATAAVGSVDMQQLQELQHQHELLQQQLLLAVQQQQCLQDEQMEQQNLLLQQQQQMDAQQQQLQSAQQQPQQRQLDARPQLLKFNGSVEVRPPPTQRASDTPRSATRSPKRSQDVAATLSVSSRLPLRALFEQQDGGRGAGCCATSNAGQLGDEDVDDASPRTQPGGRDTSGEVSTGGISSPFAPTIPGAHDEDAVDADALWDGGFCGSGHDLSVVVAQLRQEHAQHLAELEVLKLRHQTQSTVNEKIRMQLADIKLQREQLALEGALARERAWAVRELRYFQEDEAGEGVSSCRLERKSSANASSVSAAPSVPGKTGEESFRCSPGGATSSADPRWLPADAASGKSLLSCSPFSSQSTPTTAEPDWSQTSGRTASASSSMSTVTPRKKPSRENSCPAGRVSAIVAPVDGNRQRPALSVARN